ncbi:site-specific DNA-methyltransferase [Pseudoalteromonas shioyasakiensis]|uniref:DNA methyltransferase n=1 Tax=Pseudoalteromonas shioyasakiensis TaxID=1190813 RepID=UPI002117CF46|nr:DNA methyltransferase [Pseudoalteromonas shioyasakiensis]MCQ8879339.1 site-specific DNA-methyltransferase [Pseudoalteromonas shioyasakiensis]
MQQDSLLDDTKVESPKGPVECLGQTFENEEARRAHFTEILREKLKEPEFRKIEGFPIGTDEAILELSDAPYYTACPNPWLNDFVEYWESQKDSSEESYHREPFAADVSEGKNDPIYNAHSYHTKVPHKAIMRYILHYTKPGDIVFDGFCGTGMTGVAAQMCGDRDAILSLGLKVKDDGTILQKESADEGSIEWVAFSKIGARKVILNDLSPAATFISNNYNAPIDLPAFESEALKIINDIETEYSWLYETSHIDGKVGNVINTIWSDVFVCFQCSNEVVFWDEAIDSNLGKVLDSFDCPHCKVQLTKKNMERAWDTIFDTVLNESIKKAKQVPVVINYTVDGEKGKFSKVPDDKDLKLLKRIEQTTLPFPVPVSLLTDGYNTRQPKRSHGFTHAHHFYTKRNLLIMSVFWDRLKNAGPRFPFLFTASQRALSKMASIAFSYYFNGGGGYINAGTKGTLYVSSTNPEVSVFHSLKSRIRSLKFDFNASKLNYVIETKSTTNKSATKDNSIDYLFIDPPFGSNINYSELNTLWEPWLGVTTSIEKEAIENTVQGKNISDYRVLMTSAFREAYRVLKPNRWMTVEFSNTKASVWNNIQTALTESGFVVANVSALDKKQGSFKAYTSPTAVKQDLVITAYKPSESVERSITNDDENSVWDFIKTHLNHLPIIKREGNCLSIIPERDPRILFDQIIAYYVRNGKTVPISSQEFQSGLKQHFAERDGMFFTLEQVSKYDHKRISSPINKQLSIFINDEASAIEWLRGELKNKPKIYSDISPLFLSEISGWKKNELQLELMTLLEQNFIKYDGNEDVPNQIHTYLSTNFKDMRGLAKDDPALVAKAKDRWYVPDPSKAGDIEKLRLRALLREFDAYKEEKKKIKQPRAEALRAGFNACWENQELQTILDISAKIPPAVLQEDEKLLMFYDNALTLTSNDDDDWD